MNMVKKLVCGVISAAVALGAASAWAAGTSSYVQDGLIACWDGIENAGAGTHDGDATVWKDVKGGYEFSLTGVAVDDDRMTFAGTSSSYGTLSAADTTSTFVAAKNGTMEIVYASRTGSGTQVLLQSTESAGLAFGLLGGNTILPYTNGGAKAMKYSFTSGSWTNSVAVRYTSGAPASAIANGSAIISSGEDTWVNPGSVTFIGKRASDAAAFSGSIYCIRLYSRQLTDAEIAANQAIDQIRFIDHLGPDTLKVTTSAEGIGSPSPACGYVNGLAAGETVSVSCGNAVVTNSNGSVYSCTGWKTFREDGTPVSSGPETSFTYAHPSPAAYRELQWQWEMTVSPTNYVQDGLIACWDGIENAAPGVHVDGTNVWKDIVGGCEFNLTGTTVGDNCMTFLGTSTSYGTLSATDTASTFLAAKSGTLEIAYRSTSSAANQVMLQSTAASGLAFGIYGTTQIIPFSSGSQSSQLTFSLASGTSNNFVAVRYSSGAPVSALANGTALTASGGSSWSVPGQETFLGNRQNKGNGFVGSIYAIRLYSRRLTDMEIIDNQTVDQQRFSQSVDNSRLVISSTPEGAGRPSPADGYVTGLAAGDTRIVTCGGAITWTNAAETIEYSCAGWRLYDANDSIVDSGNTLSFSYTHPTPAAFRRLEWVWQPSAVKGTVVAGADGSVSPSGTAWYAADTPITVTATPDSGKRFVIWTGTMPAVSDLAASATFTPTAPFEMTANFGVGFCVATTGSDDDDGSAEHPFATISNAIEKAAAAIDLNGGRAVIRLAAGTYNESGLVLDRPISVVGASRDGVEIVDNVAGKRAFTLSHEGAAVRNLTISGNGIKTNGSQGGHVRMTAGLVSNCVIKDGRAAGAAKGTGHGGNVWMSGGRLERCFVANGRANWGGFAGADCFGMGLYASGGTIDSCFFKDNRDDNNDGRNYGSVCLNGAVTMVNCTVTGGYSRYASAAGIYINSANATVVNCVAYGNYGNKDPIVSTADSNFGNKNLGRYFHCAAAFTNASCATWTVLTDADFVNYKSFAIPTHNYAPTFTELVAYMNSSDYADFDMHLRLASPAVDGGTTDPAYRPDDCATLDLDGNERVFGASIDLGCWEYDHTQFSCGGSLSSYGVFENDAVTFNGFAAGPSVDIVFRWDYGNGVTEDTREAAHVYRYAAGGYFTVKVKASPDGGTTWTDWYTVPVCIAVAAPQMFVDSNCATPVYPYKTRATAANTLGAAVGALTNNASANQTIIGGVDIVVLKGSRSNDTGFFLATPITIRGESVNPADAEIVDQVSGSRAFTITHADAVVSNLTISGSGLMKNGGQGGHIRMTAGKVSNCVIKNGRAAGAARGSGHGGNVWMTGGRLDRCLVSGGTANWGGFATLDCFGMGLYASGGTIDSCFFKDNRDDNNDGRNYGSVCLAGTATMVNCTVTGGYSRYDTAAGIYVNAAAAKVVNCVAYGNYGNKSPIVNTAASNFGNKNLNRFYYCAAAFTNASCATWTVLTDADFVKYESFTGNTYTQLNTYMTSAEYATFDWHQKRDSQLIGRGTLDTAYRPADSVTRDLDGNERVLNRTIDLGCWEKMLSVGFFYILR